MSMFTRVNGGDAIVRRDVDDIRYFLREQLGTKLIAIVLCGSFGRGEGSMARMDGDSLSPVNDYDFLVVVDGDNSLPSQEEIRNWEQTCAAKVAVQFVDFAMTTKARLTKLKLSQATYDIKWGSVVLDGPEDILDSIPSFDAATIPVVDGQVLMTTRHWCFLGILPIKILEADVSLTEDDKTFACQQLSKALIAAGDSELIRQGQYRTGYGEKAQLVAALDALKEQDQKTVLWGYQYKLGQCEGLPDGLTLRDIFLQALSIHLNQVKLIRRDVPLLQRIGISRGIKGVYTLLRCRSIRSLRGWVLDAAMLRVLGNLQTHQGEHACSGVDRLLLRICSGKSVKNLSSAAAISAELRLL